MARIGVQAMMLKESVAEIGAFETLRRVRESAIAPSRSRRSRWSRRTSSNWSGRRMNWHRYRGALGRADGVARREGDSLEDGSRQDRGGRPALGAEMVRIGMLPFEAMGSLERARLLRAHRRRCAARLADSGIRLYYHNHHVEFAKFDGRLMLDIIADRAPPRRPRARRALAAARRGDPVSVIEQYAGRVRMVHLKDYRIGRLPDSAFEALAQGDIAGFMTAFAGVVQFGEVGEGNLDFAAIIPAAIASGAEYLLVEQDDLYGRTVWEALQTSHDNLVSLGFADLF